MVKTAQTKQDRPTDVAIRHEVAINALIGGASVTEAAKAAGYSRETLSRLLHGNVFFQAELNKRRAETKNIVMNKLLGLLERVIEGVEGAIKNTETPPGVVLQSGLAVIPKLYSLLSEQGTGSVQAGDLAIEKASKISMNELLVFDEKKVQKILSDAEEELKKAQYNA
ncbi:hypothetical protein AGMMS50276_31070 [Synergistales bacterium]|nr:hypothetical protein AGMMS50276_31070 [Synergistales bacterium]